MNKRRRLLFFLPVLLFCGYYAYDYVYKDHRTISSETSSLEIAAPYLLERFNNNDGESLLNKTITVNGIITLIEEGAISIDSSVYCMLLNETSSGLKNGDEIKLKGRCIGYDELFGVVKLDQCTLIK